MAVWLFIRQSLHSNYTYTRVRGELHDTGGKRPNGHDGGIDDAKHPEKLGHPTGGRPDSDPLDSGRIRHEVDFLPASMPSTDTQTRSGVGTASRALRHRPTGRLRVDGADTASGKRPPRSDRLHGAPPLAARPPRPAATSGRSTGDGAGGDALMAPPCDTW